MVVPSVSAMTPITAEKTALAHSLTTDGDAIKFSTVSCLLTAEELDGKCVEQFEATWNGPNTAIS